MSPVSLRHLWVKLISTSESFGQNVDVTLALLGVGSTSIIVITVINFQSLCGHIWSIPTGKRHNSDATSTSKRRSDVAPTPKTPSPHHVSVWDWVHTFNMHSIQGLHHHDHTPVYGAISCYYSWTVECIQYIFVVQQSWTNRAPGSHMMWWRHQII